MKFANETVTAARLKLILVHIAYCAVMISQKEDELWMPYPVLEY